MRRAADIAERFAAGHLDERMPVHGDDELARLAASFNGMAGEHPEPDPPAGGVRRAAAAVHLRRLARAAHPADHRADGRRRAARRAGRLPPALRRSPELLVAELDRFEALLADLLEISRLRRREWPTLDAEPIDMRGVVTGRSRPSAALAERARHAAASAPARRAVHRRGRPPAGRADPAQPARQRDRPRRGPAGRVTLAGDDDALAVTVRDHGVGLRPGEAAWCSTGSGAPTRPAHGTPAAPAWGWRSAGGRPAARRLAAGLGRSPARARVPAHPAPRPGEPLTTSPLPLVPDDRAAVAGAERLRPRRPRTRRPARCRPRCTACPPSAPVPARRSGGAHGPCAGRPAGPPARPSPPSPGARAYRRARRSRCCAGWARATSRSCRPVPSTAATRSTSSAASSTPRAAARTGTAPPAGSSPRRPRAGTTGSGSRCSTSSSTPSTPARSIPRARPARCASAASRWAG